MAKTPTWQRSEGKNPEGGLNEKGRASLRAAGHDIKRPQPEGGSRRDSFCARMKGMKEKLTSSETASDPDSRINKSLRKWNCADGGAVDPYEAVQQASGSDRKKRNFGGLMGSPSGGGSTASMFQPQQMSLAQNPVMQASAPAPQQQSSQPNFNTQALNTMQFMNAMNPGTFSPQFGGYFGSPMSPFMGSGMRGGMGGFSPYMFMQNPELNYLRTQNPYMFSGSPFPLNTQSQNQPLPQGVDRNSLLGLLGMIYGVGNLGPFMSYKDGGSVEPYDNVQKAAKGGEVWDKPRPKNLGESKPLSSKQKASAKAAAKAAGRPYPNLVDNMRAARADGGEVWDRPRPKDLGEPKELSSKKKSKAKAMAKAAGRPYPNLIDNMRAARAQKADGGELEGDVQFLEDDPYGKVQQAAVPMMAREEYAQRMPVEDKADELRRIAQEPSYADLFNAPLKYGVQTMVSPDIAPQRVAKSLVEMPETVKQFGKGLAESAYSGATLPGDVVTGQVDPMSEEGMRRATDLAGLAQTGSFAFTRPAGSLASGASREASAGEPAIAGMGHNQPPVETPVEPSAYQRFLNPAGFYSHGHEVAMTQLPEGPRTWQEMSALLNKGNVKKEELRWAGLLPEAYDPSHKITREEIAQQFERNFPQVEPVWKQNDTRIQEWQNNVRNAQSQLAKAEEVLSNYHDNVSQNPFYSADDVDWKHKARQIKAAMREGSTPIEKLPPEFQEAAAAYKRDYDEWKMAHENYERVRQLPAPESVYEKPKWEQYTYPGGSDYRESILKIPYNDPRAQTKIHPDIAQRYAQEQENLNAKLYNLNEEYAKQKTIDVKNFNDATYAFEQRFYDAVLNSALKDGHSPERAMAFAKTFRDNTPYDGMENYLGEKRPSLYDFHGTELMNLEKQLAKTKDELDLLRTKQIDESKPLFNIPAYTSELYQHTTHLGDIENPLLHQRWKERLGPQGEKILSNEEFQSDWGQTGKEQGFKDAAIDKKREELQATIDDMAARTNLLRKTAGEEFDAQSPFMQAYKERHTPNWLNFKNSKRGSSDLEKFNQQTREDSDYVESLGLGTWNDFSTQRNTYVAQRTMENDARLKQLRQELDNLPETGETPLAPHIGSNEQWIELGAKHALSHAIENGHDKIFIMGGQEHARRYGTELRKAVDNIEWIKPDNDANLKNWRDLRAKQIYGKESSYDSLPQEIKNQIDEKAASLQQFQPNVKTVYATPKGGGSRNYFIVDKDGKVVDSDIYDAKPKKGKKISLASVIGGDLAKRVMNEESGNVPMANYIMGSEGYTQHYERKVPSIYKDIIKKYLKVSPKVEAGPLMERDESFGKVGKAVPGTGQIEPQGNDLYRIVYPDGSFRGGYRLDAAQAVLEGEQRVAQRMQRDREARLADRVVQFRDSHSQGQLAAIIPGYLQMEPIEQSNAVFKYVEDLEKSGVKRGPQGTYIHITPEMREAYNKIKREKGAVFPGYKQGGKVVNKPDPYDNVRKAAKIFPRAQRAFH